MVGMMLFLILVVIVMFGFRITQYMVTAAGVEDALAASNLAAAIIDVEEYGRSHIITISDPDKAFQMYRDALCYNLKLDDNLMSSDRDFLVGQVEIQEFIIYNVQGNMVNILGYDGKGQMLWSMQEPLGTVVTGNHVNVETTTIYSRIGYWVEGLAGNQIYGEKEKSVDIARCDVD